MNAKIWKQKIKSFWQKGKIQRFYRISYDIFWNIILFFLVIGFIGLFFAGGIGAGYFASLVKDEDIRSADQMANDIYNYEATSKLYFANDIYLSDVRADLHREEIELKNISETLIQAVIATEDEYFHEHKGVVPKAIIRAIVQEVTNADMKTGGSTLTQQLIKNQILTNEVSFDRKAKEILLALRLERFFEKDEILEAYLNIIPYGREASGRNIAGIQTAAKGVFGVNADEVNLPQAAFLAGLPQSPSVYTPFQNTGELKNEEGLQPGINRMNVVLKRMYDLEYITEEDYNNALNYDIVADFIEDKTTPVEKYGYLTDELQEEAKEILFKILIEENGYTMEDVENDDELRGQFDILASRELRTGGYNIHSTIDKDIYDEMQKVVKNFQHYNADWEGYIKDEETGEQKFITQQVQVGGILIENHTGKVISFVGGRGYSLDNQFNYISDGGRPNGSTMKPLLAFPAALEKGYIQPGTPIADIKVTNEFPDPSEPDGYWRPFNYGRRHYGIVPARTALAHSYNVSTAKIYEMVISENPAKDYLDKMGITSLVKGDYSTRSLALGQPQHGISVEENVNAFATLGNNGKFVDAYMIEKITNQDGDIIYEHKPKSEEVFTPQSTYLTLDMMRDVIKDGTGTYLSSQLKYNNVDWAAKTGTSSATKDLWFVGINPNVTFGTWMGYDFPQSLEHTSGSMFHSHINIKLWAELINSATDLNPDLLAPQERFKRPEGIVERSYCAISGMMPSKLCEKIGLVKTDLFNEKYVPTEVDDSLIEGSYVLINGKAVIAGPNTPKEFIEGDGVTFNPEFLKRNGYDELDDLTDLFPTENRKLWEKIGIPSGDLGDVLEDDGKEPTPPTSLRVANNKLVWDQSKSKDVVGYRVYYASSPDGDFKRIGSTTNTEVKFSGDQVVFHVTSVDYFGHESDPSNEVIVGDFSDVEQEEPDKESNDRKPPKNKDEEYNEHNDREQYKNTDNKKLENKDKNNKEDF